MIVYAFCQKKRRRLCRDLFCRFGLRRELDHQLSATDRDTFLVERVKRLLAFFAHAHQICLAQNGEMVRDGGLGHIQFFHDLAHRERVATYQVHDLLAGLIGNGFGE